MVKRALLVGINYEGTKSQLSGCINDVMNVKQYLESQGFSSSDIRVMADDHPEKPTKHNITEGAKWLLDGVSPGDSLFFHYSGHGGQSKDLDGDEKDGFDECIFPVDYQTAGSISDDVLHATLVAPLPKGAKLRVIMDCCHSGTGLDLPLVYRTESDGTVKLFGKEEVLKFLLKAGMDAYKGNKKGAADTMLHGLKSMWASHKHEKEGGGEAHEEGVAQDSNKDAGDVVLFAGCDDSQTSADTSIGGKATGAMSYAFLKSITSNPNQTYKELLLSIREILLSKYTQVPQLCTGHEIDLDRQFEL